MSEMPVKPDTHVVKRPTRSKFYYFRMEIPKEVRAYFGGKTAFEQSLKTTDTREANRLACPLRAESYQKIDQARQLTDSPDSLPLVELKAEWHADQLEQDDAARSLGMAEHVHDMLSTGITEIEQPEVSRGLALGQLPEYLKPSAGEFLAVKGLDFPEGSEARRRVEYAILQAHSTALGDIEKRQSGIAVPTPERSAAAVYEPATTHGLMAMLGKYQNERNLDAKMLQDITQKLRAFIEVCGDKPIRKYTKQDGIKFKEVLLAQGLAASTISSKYLGWVNVLFNWAAGEDYVEQNPLTALKVKGGKVKQIMRLPYAAEELSVIFSSPVYTDGTVAEGGKGAAAFWLPLLGLFTGARLEELAQLAPSDIHQHAQGIYISITDYSEGTSVKTAESRRRVPIHPELIRIGFEAYLDSVKDAPLLFPLLKADCKGDISGNWSKWWGRWCRQKLGITDKRKVFHSFRHGFKHLCREAGISEEVHDALTGHAGGTVSRSYKDTFYPLAPLFEAMQKFKAPIDLSDVTWTKK